MSKIAIVGCDASGKTVLISALSDYYQAGARTDQACIMVPSDATTRKYTDNLHRIMRIDREWPAATNDIAGDSTLKWRLLRNGRTLADMEMMDFGGYTTLEQMRSITPEELNDLAIKFTAETGKRPVTSPYVDGVIVTEDMEDAIADGTILDIPYIIGATADDLPFGKGAVLDEFCNLINEHNTQPIYQYSFDRNLPGDDSGAFHGSDLWYTFHTVGRNWRPWTDADYALSEEMIEYWTNFVKYGDPNGAAGSETTWEAYTLPNPFKKSLNVK